MGCPPTWTLNLGAAPYTLMGQMKTCCDPSWWAAVVWIGLLCSAAAGPPCVVCGEPTRGSHAVVHGSEAYAIHPFPCRGVWDRAVEAGLLDDVAERLEPGSPLFDAVRQPAPAPRAPGGGVTVVKWGLFLLAAMTTSGLLALFLGSLFGRARLAAFLLGFFVPAVGMALVPVLPESKSRRTAEAKGKENA